MAAAQISPYTYAAAAPTITYGAPVTYAAPAGGAVTYAAPASAPVTYAGGQITYAAPVSGPITYAAPQAGAPTISYISPQAYDAGTAPAGTLTYTAPTQTFAYAQPQYAAEPTTVVAPQTMTIAQAPQVTYAAAPEAVTYAAAPQESPYAGAVTVSSTRFAAPAASVTSVSYGQPVSYGVPVSNFGTAPSMVAYPQYSVYYPSSVQQAWEHHGDAVLNKDVEKGILDYDDSSIIRTFNQSNGERQEYRGLAQIRSYLSLLAQELQGPTEVQTAFADVEDEALLKQVFVVWSSPAAGYKSVGETLIFGHDFKIKRQNVVFTKEGGFRSVVQVAEAAASSAAAAVSPTADSPKKGSSSKKASKKKARGCC